MDKHVKGIRWNPAGGWVIPFLPTLVLCYHSVGRLLQLPHSSSHQPDNKRGESKEHHDKKELNSAKYVL